MKTHDRQVTHPGRRPAGEAVKGGNGRPDGKADARQGLTRPQLGDMQSQTLGGAPRLPHERDESSDSHADRPRQVIRKAHDDLVEGRVDTDRGTPMNDAYERQKDLPKKT